MRELNRQAQTGHPAGSLGASDIATPPPPPTEETEKGFQECSFCHTPVHTDLGVKIGKNWFHSQNKNPLAEQDCATLFKEALINRSKEQETELQPLLRPRDQQDPPPTVRRDKPETEEDEANYWRERHRDRGLTN